MIEDKTVFGADEIAFVPVNDTGHRCTDKSAAIALPDPECYPFC
jgi:hypothetical protein